MKNKTRIKILFGSQFGDYKEDDRGYIDGYIKDRAVVVLDSGRIVLVGFAGEMERE